MLNGQETEFSPKTPDGKTGKGKRTAKWSADGIDVSEKATFESEEGAVNIQTTRKWTLSKVQTGRRNSSGLL